MSKNFKKYGAMFITGMLVATMSMTAWATVAPGESGAAEEPAAQETTQGGSEAGNSQTVTTLPLESGVVTIKKDVTTDGKTYAPNTKFTVNVTAGTITGNYTFGNDTYYAVTAGPTDGIATEEATFTPAADTLSAKYTSNFTVDLSGVTFPHAGVYSYKVTEAAGSYEGVTYDTDSKDMLVFVINDNGGLKVENVILLNTAKTAKIDTITNLYGSDDDTTDKIHDLTISKAVTGNAANMSETFKFDVMVNGADGEMYKVYLVTGEGENESLTEKDTLTSGTAKTFENIANGTKLRIYGLSEGDTVSVNEQEAGLYGYTTSYVVENNKNGNKAKTTLADAEAAATANALTDGATLTITNNRDNVTPTGVAMDIAPYAFMLVLAGGAAVTFFRKRQYFED